MGEGAFELQLGPPQSDGSPDLLTLGVSEGTRPDCEVQQAK